MLIARDRKSRVSTRSEAIPVEIKGPDSLAEQNFPSKTEGQRSLWQKKRRAALVSYRQSSPSVFL